MSSILIHVFLFSVTTAIVQSGYIVDPATQRRMSAHKQVATWEEAKQNCEREGAILASPLDMELLKSMRSIITVNNHTTPYYIGMKARHNAEYPTRFVSQEAVPLDDVQEAMDMVEQLDSRNGDCLCMDGHSIRVVPCWTRLPYICYTNVLEKETTETPTTIPIDCNTGYELDPRTGKYYKFNSGGVGVSWDEANSSCTADGGYLAILNDPFEARIVNYKAFPLGSYNYAFVWIGLRGTSGNGDYQSVHGNPIKGLYNVFEKRRESYKYDCVVLRFDKKLESWPCTDKLQFVCEKNNLDTC